MTNAPASPALRYLPRAGAVPHGHHQHNHRRRSRRPAKFRTGLPLGPATARRSAPCEVKPRLRDVLDHGQRLGSRLRREDRNSYRSVHGYSKKEPRQ